MSSLLDLPAIRERAARLSVEEYHRLGERPVELLRGTIIEKFPKLPLHQYYTDQLRRILEKQIRPEMIIRQEGPLTFSDSEPEPDLAVLPGPAALYRTSHPATADLAIEVAVSSWEIDRIKAAIYAEAGVKEYWIVCPEEREIEVFQKPSGTNYLVREVIRGPFVAKSSILVGAMVDLAELFA